MALNGDTPDYFPLILEGKIKPLFCQNTVLLLQILRKFPCMEFWICAWEDDHSILVYLKLKIYWLVQQQISYEYVIRQHFFYILNGSYPVDFFIDIYKFMSPIFYSEPEIYRNDNVNWLYLYWSLYVHVLLMKKDG